MPFMNRRLRFDETWQGISSTVDAVLGLRKVTRKDWNERFTDVYSLCVAYPEPMVEKLYEEIKALLKAHVNRIYCELSSGTYYLELYHSHWSQYNRSCEYLDLLFRHLNIHIKKGEGNGNDMTTYSSVLSDNECKIEVGQLALRIWKEIVIQRIKEKLIPEILAEVKRDREGGNAQRDVIQGAIESLVIVQQYFERGKLELYEGEFEKKLLVETTEFYKTVSSNLVSELTCSAYLVKADSLLRDEKVRTSQLFHHSSTEKVNKECERQLVESHVALLESECRQMIKEENLEGLEAICCIDKEKTPANFVRALLQVHRKYLDLINTTFSGEKAFLMAFNKAFYVVVNSDKSGQKSSQSAELLARFADSILKKNQRNMSENEQEENMADIILLFKYLDNKDIFQKFYSKMLAKRLIHNTSISMDAEENMINRLKHTCGYEYTNNLHRMFTDMSLSEDLNKSFYEDLARKNSSLDITASYLILQSGAWPLAVNTVSSLTIPQEFVDPITWFEQFYGKRFQGRKLTWLHHLSNGEVRLNHFQRPYIVTASSYQMAVMLLFNHSASLSFGEILAQTEIAEKELERTLKSLVDVKLLLSFKDAGSATYTCNPDFSNKRTKLKITVPVLRETTQEANRFRSSIDEDRKLYIQANVVRVMKARKVLKHNTLVQEVISQSKTRFSPSVSMIKKAIESLIDKQYLERKNGSKDEYTYLA
ncbi:cullin-2-like isoform X2 [Xenia sp. Carnegie-2017]|uniref:cullin-2-like isoform X2 n=1 Tax=Xenia sp. Carnegie-2017 TaxID=2897299 RepID=UPI001F036FA6|nr:cullin-2-like isoform X2 [Xenia sp. Carnegie-2017]